MSLLAKWCGLCLMTVLMGLVPLHSIAARDLTIAEQASLARAVERLSDLFEAQNWPAMIEGTIPPRILNGMLERGGQTKEQLLRAIADIMAETMAKVKVQSYSIDLAKAEKKELADGTPYVLIPTETIAAVDGSDKVAMRSYTLAMMDGDQWYLMKVSELKQVLMLVEAYPEYKGVEFPSDKVEILEE